VEKDVVRLTIESETTDAKGHVVSTVVADESRPASWPPVPAGSTETIEVAGRRLPVTTSRDGESEVARSAQVPLGGLVRARGPGGTTQVLVGYGREGD
jgi:hypothetical protein